MDCSAIFLAAVLLDDFQEETAFRVEKIEAKVDRYEDELGTYLIKLNQKDLSQEDSHSLSIMLQFFPHVKLSPPGNYLTSQRKGSKQFLTALPFSWQLFCSAQ